LYNASGLTYLSIRKRQGVLRTGNQKYSNLDESVIKKTEAELKEDNKKAHTHLPGTGVL